MDLEDLLLAVIILLGLGGPMLTLFVMAVLGLGDIARSSSDKNKK